jgi:hypothetical protein
MAHKIKSAKFILLALLDVGFASLDSFSALGLRFFDVFLHLIEWRRLAKTLIAQYVGAHETAIADFVLTRLALGTSNATLRIPTL